MAQLFFFFHIRESIYICWISGSGRSPWIDDDRSHVIIRYDGKTRVHEELLAGGVIQKWLRLERSPDQDLIFHEEIETRVLCCGTTHIHSQCFCSLLVRTTLSIIVKSLHAWSYTMEYIQKIYIYIYIYHMIKCMGGVWRARSNWLGGKCFHISCPGKPYPFSCHGSTIMLLPTTIESFSAVSYPFKLTQNREILPLFFSYMSFQLILCTF
jgi:hypothetical protein